MSDSNGEEYDSPLGGLFAQISQQHEQAHQHKNLHARELNSSILNLIGELNREQLYVLRRMLGLEPESAPMNYFDGLVAGALYFKLGVNPFNGKTLDEEAAEATATDVSGDS